MIKNIKRNLKSDELRHFKNIVKQQLLNKRNIEWKIEWKMKGKWEMAGWMDEMNEWMMRQGGQLSRSPAWNRRMSLFIRGKTPFIALQTNLCLYPCYYSLSVVVLWQQRVDLKWLMEPRASLFHSRFLKKK